MNLIDEEDTGYDLGTTFLSPLSDFLVDLFSNLGFDLTDISSEECHETLCARIDNINLMKSDSVHNFLALLQLTLGALNEASLWADIVKVAAAGERATKLGDFAASFIDGNDVAGNDLLFRDSFDHLRSKVVLTFHLGCLESDLACLGSTCDSLVNLDLDDLSLNDFSFFSDPHTYVKIKDCVRTSIKIKISRLNLTKENRKF